MSRARSLLQGFFRLNRDACGQLKPLLPHTRARVGDLYVSAITGHMNELGEGAIILDVGGGRQCAFAKHSAANGRPRIVAIDISRDELQHNRDVDGMLVADVVQSLPFRTRGVDMIVSRSVLEHLRGTEAFFEDASRVLKPQGYFIHLFPCRFAPFALLNQLLGPRVSRRVVHFFRPGSDDRLGFRAYYDHCYPTGIRSLLRKFDFDVAEIRLTYGQSGYFEFFLPLFLLSVAYELLVYTLGIRNLCAYVLVVARKN